MTASPPHRIAVLALESVVTFDLTIPCEVFSRAPGAPPPYEVVVCAEQTRVGTGFFDLVVRHDLSALAHADTIVVPAVHDLAKAVSPAVTGALRAAAARGARIASICGGAFVLAAAGLLDGLRATTHWVAAAELAARFPAVRVDAGVLYVDEGQILTSAGAAAGLDLCLHMVRCDHGAAMAADCARLSVVALERHGGQAQFITHQPPATAQSLAPLLEWMAAHPDEDLSLEKLAARAGMTTRTFSRRFREQTGATPLQWTLLLRVRRAQALLESTSLPIEAVASASGFRSAINLRERFVNVVGASPYQYRRAFSARSDGTARAHA